MSENPLEPSPERAAAIRAKAEALWKEAGRSGSVADYLEQAEDLVGMERAGETGQLPIDTPIVIVEEAKLQENLGEFPGGSSVADQGEWRETPMTRQELREGGDDVVVPGDSPDEG